MNNAATPRQIAAARKIVKGYSNDVLFCEHRAAFKDACAIVNGTMSADREARLVALAQEMKLRGL